VVNGILVSDDQKAVTLEEDCGKTLIPYMLVIDECYPYI
jgi:hypothetical protein